MQVTTKAVIGVFVLLAAFQLLVVMAAPTRSIVDECSPFGEGFVEGPPRYTPAEMDAVHNCDSQLMACRSQIRYGRLDPSSPPCLAYEDCMLEQGISQRRFCELMQVKGKF